MDFKTAFNLTDKMSHEEKYTTIVNRLGYDSVKALIPFSRTTIINALETDEHLNNLSLRKWDDATGFKTVYHGYYLKPRTTYIPTNDKLVQLCRSKGVTCFSLAQLVCILKRCAVMWAEENDVAETTCEENQT